MQKGVIAWTSGLLRDLLAAKCGLRDEVNHSVYHLLIPPVPKLSPAENRVRWLGAKGAWGARGK